MSSSSANGQGGVAIILDQTTARTVDKIRFEEDRPIKVRLEGKPVDVVIVQVYMPTTNYKDEELHCVSKKVPTFKLSVTLSNLNQYSKFLHCWKACKICYKSQTTSLSSP